MSEATRSMASAAVISAAFDQQTGEISLVKRTNGASLSSATFCGLVELL